MAAVVVKMEKDKFRAVIKCFYLKKWTAAQIKAKLNEVHGDSSSALKTIYFWINEFKRGWTSIKDEAHPIEVNTPDMIDKNPSYRHGRSPNEGAQIVGIWVVGCIIFCTKN